MKRRRPEQALQKAVFAHLRQRGVPGIVAWHTPNGLFAGGKRNRKGVAINASIMSGMGMLAGIPDVLVLYRGYLHCLELKVGRKGPSDAQEKTISDLAAAGARTGIAFGLDQAIDQLEQWELVRGSAAIKREAA